MGWVGSPGSGILGVLLVTAGLGEGGRGAENALFGVEVVGIGGDRVVSVAGAIGPAVTRGSAAGCVGLWSRRLVAR